VIWADRMAVGALALAGMFFAYLYATGPSWKEAWVEQAEQKAVVMHCYFLRSIQAPCTIPEPKIVKVRTLGTTGLEFLNFAFWVVLPVWLVLRLIDFAFRWRKRRRTTLAPE
jgi:hypothetical protein